MKIPVIGFLFLLFKLQIHLYDDVAMKRFDEGSWPRENSGGGGKGKGGRRGGEMSQSKFFPIFVLKGKIKFNALKSEVVNTST